MRSTSIIELLREGFDALLFNCSQPEVMADAIKAGRAELGTASMITADDRGVYTLLMDDEYAGANTDILGTLLDNASYLHFALLGGKSAPISLVAVAVLA